MQSWEKVFQAVETAGTKARCEGAQPLVSKGRGQVCGGGAVGQEAGKEGWARA